MPYIFLNYFQSFTSSNDTSSLLPRPKYETRQRTSLTRIGQSLTPLSLTLRNWIHEINSSAAENMHIYTAREGRAVSNLITILFPRELYAPANKERQRERKKERKYHFSSRCSPNKKLLKEWKCFLANYILLRTQRERERERESTIFTSRCSSNKKERKGNEMKRKRKGRNVSLEIICSCE